MSKLAVGRFFPAFIVAVISGACVAGMAAGASVEGGSFTQISGSTDVLAGLVTQGLRAASSNPPLNLGTGTVTCGTISCSSQTNSGKTTSYNGVSSAGWGIPEIVAQANITAQTAAATVTTFAGTASDSDYEVSIHFNCSAATTISCPLQVTYTDVNSTGQTMTLPVQKANGTGGTYLTSGLIVTSGDHCTPTTHIRTKASSNITLKVGTGTFTSVTYSASGVIIKTS